MNPIIDHIQITVKDLSVAEAFYDRLLPLLGFDVTKKGRAVIEEHDFQVVEYVHPLLAFAITSPRAAFAGDAVHRRKPGALHHLAFKAVSRAEVDTLHLELKSIGATIVEIRGQAMHYAFDQAKLLRKDFPSKFRSQRP